MNKRIDKLFEYTGIAQTLFIAWQYLYLWLFAQPDDAYKVYSFAILIAFEFIMVHSGVFMAALSKKYSILLFCPLYGLFAWGFNRMLDGKDQTILIIYLLTILNRMRFAFFDASKTVKSRTIALSIMAVFIYFGLLFVVVLGSSIIPAFALGTSFSQSEAYQSVSQVGGLFMDKPYTAISLGFMYYSLLSYTNYKMIRNKALFLPKS